MERFARGPWSDGEILDALRGRAGTREIAFRADILRGGIKVREVGLAPGGSVTLDMEAGIGRTARIALYAPVNELTEEIRPYMLLRMGGAGVSPQYAAFALGVFIPSTPVRRSENGVNTWSIEAYDRTVVLAEDGLDKPLYLAAGTKYLDAVQGVLTGAGVQNVIIGDYVETALPADREFDVGTAKLAVINTLLSEVNFAPAYCNAEGAFVLSAYRAPSAASPSFTYRADALSAIGRDTQTETDYYGLPNVFVGVCSNPDLQADYRAAYVNGNEESPFSTVRRGRRIISEIYRPEQIASQADLEAYVKRKAFERTQAAGEAVTFRTALMPTHGRGEDLELRHPDFSGVYRETRWTLPLEPGGEMEHVAKKAVVL